MQKIIFIDLDGTLTPQSTWLELNVALGISAEEDDALFAQYREGTLQYNDWTKALVRLHKEHDRVTREELVSLAEKVSLRPDAEECIASLKQKGFHLVLISGSVDVIVETVATKLGFDAWLACTKAVFDEQGIFEDFISSGDEGPAKVALATDYCMKHGYELASTVVVGDGGNEMDLFKITKGILLGSNRTLAPLAWKQVDTLSEIPTLL